MNPLDVKILLPCINYRWKKNKKWVFFQSEKAKFQYFWFWGDLFFLTTVVRRLRRYAATVLFHLFLIQVFVPWRSVRRLVWAQFLWLLIEKDTHYLLKIHSFPGFLFLNSGMQPQLARSERGLLGSNELCPAWPGAQNATLCPTEHSGQFVSHFTLNFFWHLSNDKIFLRSRRTYVPGLTFPGMILMIIAVDGR